MLTRTRAIELIGSAVLLASCAPKPRANALRIGSTVSAENKTIAEIYAIALERDRIPVDRHPDFSDEQSANAALIRGDIDLYPGLIEARSGAKDVYDRDGITWLEPSPANDSPCLVTSQYSAEKFWLLRLTKCSTIAPQLRLAATPDFIAPGGTLEGLRRRYGGFDFKTIVKSDPGTQLYLLNRGEADVANSVTTDPNIAETQLIVLSDDMHFWPERHPAPAVRSATLHAHPRMRIVLNRISRSLMLYALQQLNTRRAVLGMDPSDVADDFVSRHIR